MNLQLLIGVALAYVLFLFLVAFFAERSKRKAWVSSPLIYTLSLSIYCTAWTFYGAVGYAARAGFEFLTIYIGPTLVFIGWLWVLRKLVRIGRAQSITSIADLISARFGKSNALAAIVTLIAVIGITPYIALQLQSVTLSFAVFVEASEQLNERGNLMTISFLVAAGLALFTILFGTRSIDVNERHHGVIMAIAVEAVVKLVALIAVGVFIVWGVASGPFDILERIQAAPLPQFEFHPVRWSALIFVSGAAIICLPRMFHVMVVENSNENHLRTASWAFPLYLFAMSLFVIPIAIIGAQNLSPSSNPDLFVLTLPLAENQNALAMLAFLGGFSSATSMVIVAAIAISTMVSNHLVIPLWFHFSASRAMLSGDAFAVALLTRRLSIAAILLLGWGYYWLSGGGSALATIGLISFVGVAQFLPALLGGIFWSNATKSGAIAGLVTGAVLWAYTLFLPSLGADVILSTNFLTEGPFAISWLRPQALFGFGGIDPIVHALWWSLLINILFFIGGSLISRQSPLEQLQATQIVHVFNRGKKALHWAQNVAEMTELRAMAQRILGAKETNRLFSQAGIAQVAPNATERQIPNPTPQFIEYLERTLARSVGAATAHAMIAQISGGHPVSVENLLAVANETAEIREYSQQLEKKSVELAKANEKLTQLSRQKDAFLSQVSHELRTPMTSIRSFSEILRNSEENLPEDIRGYSKIISDESIRLTRLLDDILDFGVFENGQVALNQCETDLMGLLAQAANVALPRSDTRNLHVTYDPSLKNIRIWSDPDRLTQVFINLMSNAAKYCNATPAELHISHHRSNGILFLEFSDNGTPIEEENRELIFEKFLRLSNSKDTKSAGLGLAICKQVMVRLGGDICYFERNGRGVFQLTLKQPGEPLPSGE